MARGDQLAQTHLVGHVVENFAQPFLVAPVRRRSDPEDASIRIGVAHPVDDAAVIQLLVRRVTATAAGLAVDIRREGIAGVIREVVAPREMEAAE